MDRPNSSTRLICKAQTPADRAKARAEALQAVVAMSDAELIDAIGAERSIEDWRKCDAAGDEFRRRSHIVSGASSEQLAVWRDHWHEQVRVAVINEQISREHAAAEITMCRCGHNQALHGSRRESCLRSKVCGCSTFRLVAKAA